MKKSTRKATEKTSDGYTILGTTRDGVRILKPSVRPTHFTVSEARQSIKRVLRETSSGAFAFEKGK